MNNKYYFTFGDDGLYPFQYGCVLVEARSRSMAIKEFNKHYPPRDEQGLVNCAAIYNSSEWKKALATIDAFYLKIQFTCIREQICVPVNNSKIRVKESRIKNELTTTLTKINFKWLLENCTNKSLWKRTWTIYDYDDTKITFSLNAINIEDNDIYCSIKSRHHFHTYNRVITIPLDKDHYNEVVFTKKIYNAVCAIIYRLETLLIEERDLYHEAEKKDKENLEQLTDELNRKLDEENVIDDEIRELFIDAKIGLFNEYKRRDEIRYMLKHKLKTSHYLMASLMFNEKSFYDNLIQEQNSENIVDEESIKKIFEEIEYEQQEEIGEIVNG